MIENHVGKFVQQTRKEEGVTQADLKAMSGVCLSAIQKIEQGRMDVSLTSFVSALDKLGIQIICRNPFGDEVNLSNNSPD